MTPEKLAARQSRMLARNNAWAAEVPGLAVLEAIAGQQECARCGQPPSAHWHYRASPSGDRACRRWVHRRWWQWHRPRLRVPDSPAALAARTEEIR